jgi:serine/threonine-protein kinase RsbW
MISGRQERCRQEAARWQAGQDGWRLGAFRCASLVAEVVEAIAADLAAAAYPRKDLFAVRLALEEALVNAVKHGNQGDPGKEVRVRYHLTAERLLVEIEDEGAGFDPADVPDPLEPENLERTCGRGLLLMRTYMSWVKYNDRGNCVTMRKDRSA